MKNRLESIDAFRALTMFLMVFVNDLWTDFNIPEWLEHAPGQADALGFSDVIFPAFLFIVGLSLPFAQASRFRKGSTRLEQFQHILLRSVALIVMGFFQMNMEHYSDTAFLPRAVWMIIVTASFFLIWLDYSKEKKGKHWLQLLGIALLMIMAVLYKGEDHGDMVWMQSYWWGILGLIGWAYFSCATLLLLSGERLLWLVPAFIFFVFFNASVQTGQPDFLEPVRNFIGHIGLGDASNASITMAGVILAILYRKFGEKKAWLIILFIIIAGMMFAFGFASRPVWGISKIRATPSWTMICSGISVLVFLILIIFMDWKGKKDWFKWIKPAGTSTLTCYLLPYFHLTVFVSLIGIRLPEFVRTGIAGIIKSLIFALIIVLITGLLEKKRLKLRI